MSHFGLTYLENVPLPETGWAPDGADLSDCTSVVTSSPTFVGYQDLATLNHVLHDLKEPHLNLYDDINLRIWMRPCVLNALILYIKAGGYAELTASEYVRLMVG